MPDDQHIPLTQYMFMFALKTVLLALYGNAMKDDKEVEEFKKRYDKVRHYDSAIVFCVPFNTI